MNSAEPRSLSLRSLTVEGLGETALEDIDLDILPGERVVILGTAGAGKTRLLRAISGLDPVTRGNVLVGENDVTDRPIHRRDTVLLQPNYPLWPGYTVLHNITLALQHQGIDGKTRKTRAAATLTLLGLEEFQAHLPKQLTPSQRQRVALARTLCSDAAITLLDEPFSAQSAQTREQLMVVLRHHHDRGTTTTVIASEDPTLAMRLGDRIALLSEGQIVQFDTPEALYDTPVSRHVAVFLGRANLLEGEVEHVGDQPLFRSVGGLVIPLFDHRPKRARRGWAMFRPHHLRLFDLDSVPSDELIRLNGFVSQIDFAGDLLHFAADVSGTTIWASLPRHSGAKMPGIGDAVALGIDPARVRVLER